MALRAPNLSGASLEALRQSCSRELLAIAKRLATVQSVLDAIDVTAGNAPIGASYVVAVASGALTDDRVLTAGANCSIDNTTPGQAIINVDDIADEDIEDIIGSTCVGGTGIFVDYDDTAGTATFHSTLYVEEEDGNEIVEGVTGIQFDQDDGFIVTGVGGGVARINLSSPLSEAPRVLNRSFTNLQVSSTSQTTIYSYAIPSGVMSANRGLRLTWRGHFFNNDGANRSMTFRLQLDGVTIWEEPTATQTVSGTRRTLHIDAIVSLQSTTLHIANVDVRFGTAAAATTGVGDLAVEYQIDGGGESIDSTADAADGQTLTLQVAIGPSITNTNNVYVRRRGAFLELI